jgi:hypothetical protein
MPLDAETSSYITDMLGHFDAFDALDTLVTELNKDPLTDIKVNVLSYEPMWRTIHAYHKHQFSGYFQICHEQITESRSRSASN